MSFLCLSMGGFERVALVKKVESMKCSRKMYDLNLVGTVILFPKGGGWAY